MKWIIVLSTLGYSFLFLALLVSVSTGPLRTYFKGKTRE